MNITVLGHVCIDKNMSEHASYTGAGGPGMFMDRIFRQFPDVETTIVSPYGIDFLPFQQGMLLIPKHPTSKRTLIYGNTVKNTIRKQKAYNRLSAKPVPISHTISTILANTDILIIAPLLSNYSPSYLQSVILNTNPRALKVLLPQAYYRSFDRFNRVIQRQFKESSDILSLVNIVVVSKEDQINMKKEIRTWTQNHPHLIAVMTMAEKGAVVCKHGKDIMLPTVLLPKKDIVDSVGSGDIFSAGFAYCYRKTNDVRKAGKFANALARQSLFYTPSTITLDYAAVQNCL